MSDDRKRQIKAFTELGKLLTPEILQKLQNAIELPSKIQQDTGKDPILFLNSLKNWKHFDPSRFDLALQSIGHHSILHQARQLEWLSSPQFKPRTSDQSKSAKTLVDLLTTEITSQQWVVLTSCSAEVSVKGDEGSHEMLKLCVEKEIVTGDLEHLCDSLEIMERKDLAIKVRGFKSTFQNISNDDFCDQIQQELNLENEVDEEENAYWQIRLRKYLKTHHKDVSVVLDEASVPIESVFTPLTVIKVETPEKRMEEESGINEIDFLRHIHEKVEFEKVEVVDFESIVTTSDSSESKVWCLIGNPGSGKSFLCTHFAFLYGSHQLTNFRYTVSIPCRNPEWHQLEEARHEKQNKIDEEFILKWLTLSMSFGAKWSRSLSQHLLRSDGEGLFIIMDGADEFIKSIPFDSTLLCKILERRFLTLSTILVTSRPSQWTELHLDYGKDLKIDDNFQVLGFSPQNRDLYFSKRIESVEKLNAVREMFVRHDEIKQLALVPVNASLFSSLFNQSDSILSETLSHLYLQLIVYIIRRQLSRMGLKEHSKVLQLSNFDPAIRECIHEIGLEANQGIFERELTSDRHIPLKLEGESLNSERLGLMQAHVKVTSFGVRVKVWTFQHLTIQEFMAAVSICDNAWRNQCYIIRYFTTSTQYLSMYKMVIRFVSGILKRDAGFMTPVLCHHALPVPMSLCEVPMSDQLRHYKDLVDMSDCREFTQSFLLLCTVVMETNSDSIPEHFNYFKERFPSPLYLYFLDTISPNEWHCFLRAMEYVRQFQIIHFQSDYVTAAQFRSLLDQLSTCCVRYVALFFNEKEFDGIHPYTSILTFATLPLDTRVSIHLHSCDLTTTNSSPRLFSCTNQFTGSLMLYECEMNQQMLVELANQFSSILANQFSSTLQNLFYSPVSSESDWSIISQLIANHQLNGLCIQDFQGYLPVTPDISSLSSLTELVWKTKGEDSYSLIPSLHCINSLTQLSLFSDTPPSPNESLLHSLTELIHSNSKSLREINLPFLHEVGFHSWNSLFNVITSCSNLMSLKLSHTQFSSEDMSCWYRTVSALNSLVHLSLVNTPFQDSGMLVLCGSLSCHPAIRWLGIQNSNLTSASCVALMWLIQTLPRVRQLYLYEPELSSPESEQLQLLEQLAEQCSVKIRF